MGPLIGLGWHGRQFVRFSRDKHVVEQVPFRNIHDLLAVGRPIPIRSVVYQYTSRLSVRLLEADLATRLIAGGE